jgi:hypothetical protein
MLKNMFLQIQHFENVYVIFKVPIFQQTTTTKPPTSNKEQKKQRSKEAKKQRSKEANKQASKQTANNKQTKNKDCYDVST